MKKAIVEVERELEKINWALPKKASMLLSSSYQPKLDQSRELDPARLNYYQGLIGVLRWICKLRQMDVLMPVLIMSWYLVLVHEGHLEQLFHVFAYLKGHKQSMLVFNDTKPMFNG